MKPCRKRVHKSRSSVYEAIRSMQVCGKLHHPEYVNIYYCPDCRGWHWGHGHSKRKRPLDLGAHRLQRRFA